LLGRAFVAADPRALVRTLRYLVGGGLLFISLILILAERWGLAVLLAPVGISALLFGRIGPIDLGGGRRQAGSRSTVRSAFLEMTLDHDSGALTGRIMAGPYAGQSLDAFDLPQLAAMIPSLDSESVALLESYLDRRFPAWRQDAQGNAAGGQRRAASSGKMTDEEAYQILGLQPGAGRDEISRAHRTLMKKLHPDQGGSTYLAARVNEAKDTLLRTHNG